MNCEGRRCDGLDVPGAKIVQTPKDATRRVDTPQAGDGCFLAKDSHPGCAEESRLSREMTRA